MCQMWDQYNYMKYTLIHTLLNLNFNATKEGSSNKICQKFQIQVLRVLFFVYLENMAANPSDREALVVTVGCVPPEPAGLKSFLKVELKLSRACSKDGDLTPPALLRCVLQALAIQGDLQHKIKLFSKSKQHHSLLTMQNFHKNVFSYLPET